MSALVKRCQQVLTSLNYEALYIHELLIASDFFFISVVFVRVRINNTMEYN